MVRAGAFAFAAALPEPLPDPVPELLPEPFSRRTAGAREPVSFFVPVGCGRSERRRESRIPKARTMPGITTTARPSSRFWFCRSVELMYRSGLPSSW